MITARSNFKSQIHIQMSNALVYCFHDKHHSNEISKTAVICKAQRLSLSDAWWIQY